MIGEVSPTELVKCSREYICLVINYRKCLATSYVINVKIDVILQDIIPKCLGYLLRLQEMQYALFMDSLTSVSSHTACGCMTRQMFSQLHLTSSVGLTSTITEILLHYCFI